MSLQWAFRVYESFFWFSLNPIHLSWLGFLWWVVSNSANNCVVHCLFCFFSSFLSSCTFTSFWFFPRDPPRGGSEGLRGAGLPAGLHHRRGQPRDPRERHGAGTERVRLGARERFCTQRCLGTRTGSLGTWSWHWPAGVQEVFGLLKTQGLILGGCCVEPGVGLTDSCGPLPAWDTEWSYKVQAPTQVSVHAVSPAWADVTCFQMQTSALDLEKRCLEIRTNLVPCCDLGFQEGHQAGNTLDLVAE